MKMGQNIYFPEVPKNVLDGVWGGGWGEGEGEGEGEGCVWGGVKIG